jgi:hypothetical protein
MLGSSYKVNDNFEIVDGVQELIGGYSNRISKER